MSKGSSNLNEATKNLIDAVQKEVAEKGLDGVSNQFHSSTTHNSHTSNSYSKSTHDSVTTHNGVVTHEEHTVSTTGNAPDNG
jgi:hypothetical protein